MPWVKIDDGMPDHRKVEGLSAEAFRTLIKAICYCARNLTDGDLPASCFAYLGAPRYREELIAAGLLHKRAADRMTVHDYLEYNPSRERVLAQRKAAAARQNRRRHDASHAVTAAVTSPVSHAYPDPDPDPLLDQEEDQRARATRAMVAVWEGFGVALTMGPRVSDEIAEFARYLTETDVAEAVKRSAGARKPGWNYTRAILNGAAADRRDRRDPWAEVAGGNDRGNGAGGVRANGAHAGPPRGGGVRAGDPARGGPPRVEGFDPTGFRLIRDEDPEVPSSG